MSVRRKIILALLIAFGLLSISHLGPAWTHSGYLYRYFVWGPRGFGRKDLDWQLFPFHTIENAPPAFHFTLGPPGLVPATVEYYEGDTLKHAVLEELLPATGTHAFIVIKDDKLLYEKYFNGYQRDSICVSRSMAKSFTSALVGLAIQDGFIKSVDEPITNYLPELKGPGFDAITIKNLLTMGSGTRFRPHDWPWDEQPLAYFYPDLTHLMLTGLTIVQPPGTTFLYSDYNTEIVGLILRRATHRSLSDYLQEKIWKPLGMEYPATWSIDSDRDGLELAFVLMNARAIDFAKFGRLYLNDGNWNGAQIIPKQWVTESTTRDPDDNRPWETDPDFHKYGGYYKYFWWGSTLPNGDYTFEARGLFGQYIFVAPAKKVIIVRTASKWEIDPGDWHQILEYIAKHAGETTAPPNS
ncbi:MAG: serine hydrolase domain-containing protein [Candidatus Binataceae bacterium]